MTLFDNGVAGDKTDQPGRDADEKSEGRVRRHMSTIAVASAIGTLALAIGVNTWWGLGTASRILQTQVEQTGRQAAITAGRSLESLQAASAANISRSADRVLEEPLRVQAAAAALLIETAEAAGRSPQQINQALEDIANEAGSSRIDAVAERGRSYSSEGTRASQGIESRFAGLSEAVMDGVIGTATMPAVPEDGGLRKIAAAGTTHRPMIVRVQTILDTNEMAEDYGRVNDRQGRSLAEAQARAIAITMVYMFEQAEEAGWSEQQIEGRLQEIIETTSLSLVLARTDQGGTAYEHGERHWAGTIEQRQHQTARQELKAAGEGAVTLLGHLNNDRYWVVTGLATTEDGNLTSQVNVATQATNRGLLETGWQLEAERLATMEGIEGIWVAVLKSDDEIRLAGAAPRGNANDETAPEIDEDGEPIDNSTWGRWSEEHAAQAREAAAGGALVTAEVSLLSRERAQVLSAAPAGNIQDNAAIVVVQQTAADAASQMRGEALRGLGTAVLLIALIGGGTAYGSRQWLTQPIEALAEASRQLSKGERPEASLTEKMRKRPDEMGALARNFHQMAGEVFGQRAELEERVTERTKFLEAANESLRQNEGLRRKDLELARRVQQNLVSTGTRKYGPIRMASRMTPAKELGGDFVSIVERPNGTVCLAVCDVSGKGVSAALFMAAAQSALNGAANRSAGASDIAKETNQRLQDGNDLEMFMTGVIAVLTPETGQLEYVCAGHEPPISILAGQKAIKLTSSDDVPMGLGTPNNKYTARTRMLRAGETIVAYTDGIPDASNNEERSYGETRLQSVIESNAGREPEEIIQEVWTAIDVFTGRTPTYDDKTCLVLQRESRSGRRERGSGGRRGSKTSDAQTDEAA